MRNLILVTVAIVLGLVTGQAAADEERLVYVVRFSDYEEGPIDDWLAANGFRFERDARRRDRIDLDVDEDSLVLEAKRRAFGIMSNESVNVPTFTAIEIDWGVTRFPAGVSYEQGVRNEPIMVIVFMGDERQPSGSLFIPDAPYFVGLFLCHGDDRTNHPYVGTYFEKSGRYVCTDKPDEGEVVTSRFDLLEGYRTYFDVERDDDPAVSGLAVALDTSKAGEGGRSSAFIQEIRFYR